MLRYLDIVVIGLAAPLALLLGAPVIGYGIGAASWIVLRALGAAVDHHAGAAGPVTEQVALRVGYRFVRVVLLVSAAILARNAAGRDGGITALVVIVAAFTAQLAVSVVGRQRQQARGAEAANTGIT